MHIRVIKNVSPEHDTTMICNLEACAMVTTKGMSPGISPHNYVHCAQ